MKRLLIILMIAAFMQNAVAQTVFPYPDIPDTLAANDARMTYFLEHYWDNYDFADTTLIARREVTEFALAMYLSHISELDSTTKTECISKLGARAFGGNAHRKVSEWFETMIERYLDDPASPLRNEDQYILFLYAQIKAQKTTGADTTRPTARLATALMNRPGTVASDFAFTTRGVTADLKSAATLSGITAPRLLLIFYDPACKHCGEILTMLRSDADFCRQVADGSLKVLAVYTEGDRALWEKTCNELPSEWTVAIDESGIVENNIYNIPAMPVFYLLDHDKRVILKDPDITTLLQRLKK